MIKVIRYTSDNFLLAYVEKQGRYFYKKYNLTDSSLSRIERWANKKSTTRTKVLKGYKITNIYWRE